MSLILILFFVSLSGIIIMIGRKLVLLRNGQSFSEDSGNGRVLFEVPYIREIRHVTIKNLKKYGHVSLVMTLRFYIRSNNFLKNKYEETKIRIRKMTKKGPDVSLQIEVEENKFLKMISDYKHKIREIKKKINEEEMGS